MKRMGKYQWPLMLDASLDGERIRATSHLCVKRERPLIITYSLYSESIIHYHFYLKHIRGEEWS